MGKELSRIPMEPLKEEEIQIISEAIQKKDPWYYHYFMFALHTGMRRSEILALTWHDVDFWKRREIIVPASNRLHYRDPKVRRIPIDEKLLGLLLDLCSPSRWVFQKTGKRMLGGTVTIFFYELSRQLNIVVNSERIRLTYAIKIYNEIKPSSREDWKLIQKRLGHKEISTTKSYFQRKLENTQAFRM